MYLAWRSGEYRVSGHHLKRNHARLRYVQIGDNEIQVDAHYSSVSFGQFQKPHELLPPSRSSATRVRRSPAEDPAPPLPPCALLSAWGIAPWLTKEPYR